MSTDSYHALLTEITKIASSYSLATMLNGFTPELINILLHNHLEKIKQAVTYETTLTLLNDAISSQMGISMRISNFITLVDDRERLYQLFALGRVRLLTDAGIAIPGVVDSASGVHEKV